jgi:hypothetical protein
MKVKELKALLKDAKPNDEIIFSNDEELNCLMAKGEVAWLTDLKKWCVFPLSGTEVEEEESYSAPDLSDSEFEEIQEKLAQAQSEFCVNAEAEITNFGWSSGDDFICSKTTKGVVSTFWENGKAVTAFH